MQCLIHQHFPLRLAEARRNRDPPRAMFLTTPSEILVMHRVHTNPIILLPTLAQHVPYLLDHPPITSQFLMIALTAIRHDVINTRQAKTITKKRCRHTIAKNTVDDDKKYGMKKHQTYKLLQKEKTILQSPVTEKFILVGTI